MNNTIMHLTHLLFALVLMSVYNTILTTTITHTHNHMTKSKSSRRPAKFYTLLNAQGRDVRIDLNNYRVMCNITHKRVTFHHEYLNGLIHRKYAGNIDRFRVEYVTTQAAARHKRAREVQKRIDLLKVQLNRLMNERQQLTNQTTLS